MGRIGKAGGIYAAPTVRKAITGEDTENPLKWIEDDEYVP
jgi:hypothetical protein